MAETAYAVKPTLPISQSSPSHTLPESCYTTFDDARHHRTTVLPHRCYTRTSLVPAAPCPTLSCTPIPSDLVCPLYIKVSSVTVPCSTDVSNSFSPISVSLPFILSSFPPFPPFPPPSPSTPPPSIMNNNNSPRGYK
ncbi:hypothetical protein F5Y12DRAFT_551724 [Xylaria sp. FL1777]|nr:hypothetical protein F5Y12DRAFT_551724 [Xylaria sp. FL1777]